MIVFEGHDQYVWSHNNDPVVLVLLLCHISKVIYMCDSQPQIDCTTCATS